MSLTDMSANNHKPGIRKARTGIKGLDDITNGGLPAGRPTLVCGSAGCGKTLLAMEFLVHGAQQFDEPGVFISFEENASDLADNVASLGFDIPALVKQEKLNIDHIYVSREEFEETGEYDLDGLFIRLGFAIDSIKAKRVVLDTIETLFSSLKDEGILRAELIRLFRWLKDKGVTAVITGERGEGKLTRHGLEEYVSDCVILLDHRVQDQMSTRRLRIVKYRGSMHGTNEYPFLIDERGFSVLPVTSLGLAHKASDERISSGIKRLDEMLGGEGFYRGSSILLSGTAGTGKSSLAMSFIDAACRRGERCLYFTFEESPHQVIRNMRSIGLELSPWVDQGLLQIQASRPSFLGIEQHLVQMHRLIEQWQPAIVIVDPITSLLSAGALDQTKAMVLRMVDFLKLHLITGLFTSLNHGGAAEEATELDISSLMDTWLLLRDIELGGERNRGLYVLKSRGMHHSNQIREYRLTDAGIELLDVYVGPQGVLTGSARLTQEAREQAEHFNRQQNMARMKRDLERKQQALEARIMSLRADFDAEKEEALQVLAQAESVEDLVQQNRRAMAVSRQADEALSEENPGRVAADD
jgi:circadian clock protein KaiC